MGEAMDSSLAWRLITEADQDGRLAINDEPLAVKDERGHMQKAGRGGAKAEALGLAKGATLMIPAHRKFITPVSLGEARVGAWFGW